MLPVIVTLSSGAPRCEQWPLPLFAKVLPRHLELIYEINARFLDEVRIRFLGDEARLSRLALLVRRR